MSDTYSLNVKVSADLGDLGGAFDRASARVRNFGSNVADAGKDVKTGLGSIRSDIRTMGTELAGISRNNEQQARLVGQAFLGMGAAIAAGLGFAVKAAIEWETAWTGVLKTTDASGDQLTELEDGLRGLTAILPASHTEIAAVAEAAGQLGIKAKDVVAFTKVMVDLGESTNLTSDEAATSLAQFMNIMGTATDDVDRLGAAIVYLGNNGASTEKDIVQMSLRIAGAAKVVGFTEQNVLALANAMASLGIPAQLGGSSISRTMSVIASAVSEGGGAVAGFARVAGMSADDFSKKWKTAPAEALDAFIHGLGTLNDQGGNVFSTLSDLGLKGTEIRDVLLRLAGGGDILTESLAMSDKAWEENTALVNEATKRYETTASKMEIARNQVNELGIDLGAVLLPALADTADAVADVFKFFSDLPDPIKEATVVLGGVVAVVGLLGGALLITLPRIIATKDAISAIGLQAPKTAGALRGLAIAGGVAAGALTVIAIGFSIAAGNAAAANARTKEYQQTLDDFGNTTDDTLRQINTTLSASGGKGPFDWLTGHNGDSLIEQAKKMGLSAKDLQGYILGDAKAIEAVNKATKDYSDNNLFTLGVSSYSRAQEFTKALKDQSSALTEAQKEQARKTAADEAAGIAADDNTTKQQKQTAALEEQASAVGLTADEWEAASKAIQEQRDAWDEAARSFVDINGTYTKMLDDKKQADEQAAKDTAKAKGEEGDAWKKYVTDVKVSLDEYLAELQRQAQAQADWQSNMTGLVGKVSDETLNYLARLGPEGAPLVQALVDGTQEQLEEFDRLTNETMAGATAGWVENLEQAGPLLRAVAEEKGTDVANALAEKIRSGQITVAQAAAEVGATIRENVPGHYDVKFDLDTTAAYSKLATLRATLERAARTPVVIPYQANMMPSGGAIGGFVQPMAAGGLLPSLTPMDKIANVVPPNTWRVVGDRMDVPEAYIPLDGSARSRKIFDQTAAAMGYWPTRQYATGALVMPGASAPSAAAGPSLGDTLDGMALTLVVDGQPIRGIIKTEISSQARSISSGRR